MPSYRTLVPLLIFVAFAGAHRLSVESSGTVVLTSAARDIKAGQVLEARDIQPTRVQSSGGVEDLKMTFIRYDRRGTDALFQHANRNLKAGELISWRDLVTGSTAGPQLADDEIGIQINLERLEFVGGQISVGVSVGFLLEPNSEESTKEPELLEPFRVAGVGDRVSNQSVSEKQRQRDAQILTIAVRRSAEDSSQLSPDAIRLIRAAGDDPARTERLRALVMLPSQSVPGPTNK